MLPPGRGYDHVIGTPQRGCQTSSGIESESMFHMGRQKYYDYDLGRMCYRDSENKMKMILLFIVGFSIGVTTGIQIASLIVKGVL